jgi:hypothetical protein
MKFRKKPIIVDAIRWFANGGHPEDDCFRPFEDTGKMPTTAREGRIVRYFRHPHVSGKRVCDQCKHTMHEHGWIDTLEGGHNVCPGDWVIKGIAGEYYPCKNSIFEQTYEQVE